MRSISRRIAGALTLAVAVGGLTAAPASADTFTPLNTAPTLLTPSLTMPGSQLGFEPDAGASDEVYAYSVTVGDAETLNDLDTVSVCLHHSLKEDGLTAGEGDATCSTISPQNTVKLTWTRSTNAFSISAGSSSYWSLGTAADASSAPSDLTAVSGVLTFRFKVSEAMREGTWAAKATATDVSAASTADALPPTKAVAAYSSITARTQKSFGTVAADTAASGSDSPTITSNGATTMSLTAGNFTDGTHTFTLKTDGLVATGPAAGQVTFDCHIGGAFSEVSATRVGSTATSVGSATSTGTAEGGSAVSNSCRLKHGGQRPVSTYSFRIVNAVNNV